MPQLSSHLLCVQVALPFLCGSVFLSRHVHAFYKFLRFSRFLPSLVCQIKESLKHGSTTKDLVTQAGCSRHSHVADTV